MNAADLPKSVTEIASYFTAPFLQLILLSLLLTLVAGIDVASLVAYATRGALGRDYATTIAFLRDTALLPLVPVVAFFLFLLLLVGIKYSVGSVAQLLPPQIAFHRRDLLARLANPQHTLAVWNHFPTLDVDSILATVEEHIKRLQAESDDETIGQAEYWGDRAAFFMRGFDTFKVFAYIAVGCAVFGLARAESSITVAMYALVAVALLVLGAVVSLVQSLHCTYQATAQFAEHWSRSDELWKPTDEVTTTQEKVDALSNAVLGRWWHWRLAKAGSLTHYWNILRGDAVRGDAA